MNYYLAHEPLELHEKMTKNLVKLKSSQKVDWMK